MTNNAASRALSRARAVLANRPDDEDTSPAVEVAVTATEAVVTATTPPEVPQVPTAVEVVEIDDDDFVAIAERQDRSKATVVGPNPDPAPLAGPPTMRQLWLLAKIGLVRKDHELVSVAGMILVPASTDDFAAKRDAVAARWGRAVASDAIDTLLRDEPWTHPEGFTVLPDHNAVAKRNARHAA